MDNASLKIEGLRKNFGSLIATDNLSLNVHEKEIHAIIGPNGAGKTTLIGQISGEIRSDKGSIVFAGRDITRLSVAARSAIGLARSFQITSIFPNFTVIDNIALAVQAHSSHSFKFWRIAQSDPVLLEPAGQVLAQLGLEEHANELAANLSHGEQRKLEIGIALATKPNLLLLDEPMAGMGREESKNMISLLRSLKGSITIVLIEHDMDAVFALADRITVLVYGRVMATGSPDQIRSDSGVREAYLGTDGFQK